MEPEPSRVTVLVIKSSTFSTQIHLYIHVYCIRHTILTIFNGDLKALWFFPLWFYGFHYWFFYVMIWGQHVCSLFVLMQQTLWLLDTDTLQLCEGIHFMTFCCYSNHDQIAVVAKVKLLHDVLWFVYLCGMVVTLQISRWRHYSPPVAMTTNSYSRVTFSTQTALCCSSEEI